MSAKKNDWKRREGVVYSTDSAFQYQSINRQEHETASPNDQNLLVSLDRSGRNGKQVTVVSGFVGRPDDLDDLAKKLKTRCATGGSVKDGEILIQGDLRDRVLDFLAKEGFRVKRRG